ncbi:MAG: hypothetical protein NC936_01665 [Candidatus Omnitrophica bacterium]|nr:hypothetical protein [Candidatus Omnitrophota bacterium]
MGLKLNVPRKIFLYFNTKEKINLGEILRFIRRNFGKIPTKIKKIDFVKTRGLIFDFLGTENEFINKVSLRFRKPEFCHIAITDKLFATYDDFKRLHIRAGIFGYPSVISTHGIVEGPARPRDYYFLKQKYAALGVWDIEEERIKRRFKLRFIDYKDKRLTKVLLGYIAQGLFFFLTNEPFCKNKSCRLFNAHWQEDLIYSQIKNARFCLRHQRLLDILKKGVGGCAKE